MALVYNLAVMKLALSFKERFLKEGRLDIEKIARTYNISFIESFGKNEASAYKKHRRDNESYVLLPKGLTQPTREYALAHEIGHIVLDHNITGLSIPEEEMEANLFAECITDMNGYEAVDTFFKEVKKLEKITPSRYKTEELIERVNSIQFLEPQRYHFVFG
jgi:Zn-dependent peptidase ImmA (M78 family)